MEFKDRLKSLRAERGINTTTLAAQFGKSDTAVRMWETGRSKPDVDTLIKIARYFNCTTDYLLGLSGYQNEEQKTQTEEMLSRHYKDLKKIARHKMRDGHDLGQLLVVLLPMKRFMYLLEKIADYVYFDISDPDAKKLVVSNSMRVIKQRDYLEFLKGRIITSISDICDELRQTNPSDIKDGETNAEKE